ncbi:CDP-alcohol phosphatidyltransferase family protein [Candidatus Phytoplasma pruni]|uniref:CDP-alcohol phosphatidyltransferase family protein n=1 Tax=Candidatus Phytoplasma pruni TaxID=479893 RepID=A0A851HFR8_9MOLU|nr:CDP-alcohol phosphatidyltransferase family protein [Candidatus Phytoplasma pruni]NWN45480.1 CDP-alcohol phosphatidyltransferase family protein [Candidatus Phytoplasma pruni]
MKNIIKKSANFLTVFRILLVFCMLPLMFMILNFKKNQTDDVNTTLIWLFNLIFIIAAITDYLDGYIAKKFDQQTVFGKFFDPIADKLLVIITFFHIFLLSNRKLLLNIADDNKDVKTGIVMVLIATIIRDLIITGVRLVAVEKKHIISASVLGKLKTVFTFITIIFLLFVKQIYSHIWNSELLNLESKLPITVFINVLSGINIFLIAGSGVLYIIKNFKFIRENFDQN